MYIITSLIAIEPSISIVPRSAVYKTYEEAEAVWKMWASYFITKIVKDTNTGINPLDVLDKRDISTLSSDTTVVQITRTVANTDNFRVMTTDGGLMVSIDLRKA